MSRYNDVSVTCCQWKSDWYVRNVTNIELLYLMRHSYKSDPWKIKISLQIFWFLYSSAVNWTCFGCGQDICDYLGYLGNNWLYSHMRMYFFTFTGCNKQSALEVLVGGFSSSRRIPVFPVNMLSYANRLLAVYRHESGVEDFLTLSVRK